MIYRSIRRICLALVQPLWHFNTWLRFKGFGVKTGEFSTRGVPYVNMSRQGRMTIGDGLKMNNHPCRNPLVGGRCSFFVGPGARLTIGRNAGLSETCIVAFSDISIGDNVMIGAGARILSTDFHPSAPAARLAGEKGESAPVRIGDNVFIGTDALILKGVTVGDNAVIGAGSVVTKDIPANEVWGGNPARLISSL